ncbi:MAG: hypothetical protein WC969_09000 [Elusimicrobiota bacterium]|jgi:hypothetical protein
MYIFKGLFTIAFALCALAPCALAQQDAEPVAEPDFEDAEPAPRAPAAAKEEVVRQPLVLSLAENINDFGRFADGGSDSNWFIGFNNAWIVKLPPAPPGDYARAFVGARIGRAKSQPLAERPWERTLVPGQVYMGVSQTPSYGTEKSFFLAETADIPAETDASVNMPGTGRSEWFWAEVPPGLVSFDRPNYLIIWSPTREFRDALHSPILAGLETPASAKGEETRAWNNHSIQGVPPRSEQDALQVPINNLRPALALKLVPAGLRGAVRLSAFSVRPSGEGWVARFSVEGRDIDAAWLEASQDELEWKRVTPLLRRPPYISTLAKGSLPARGAYLRAAARDFSAVENHSSSVYVGPSSDGPR